ncbi:MAG: C13 family peptidase [Pseudomonadota bacterium]
MATVALAILVAGPAYTQGTIAPVENPNQPPPHTKPWPNIAAGEGRAAINDSLAQSPEFERNTSPLDLLRERRRLDAALSQVKAQRPGTVDAYVLTVALDSDPVFAREAREAAKVLSRRYGAQGRTITLAGPDGKSNELPKGSIRSLLTTLAHIGSLMDGDEDVLVLYSTSHGLQQGLAYHYGDTGYGVLSPDRFKAALEELGIERRVLIISACYSGVFVPKLASDNTAILTASADNRTSFGCRAENDWTYFGDAMINRALRKPQSLEEASQEANLSIAEWETRAGVFASLPQIKIGDNVDQWMPALTARMPRQASAPVGRPAAGEFASREPIPAAR